MKETTYHNPNKENSTEPSSAIKVGTIIFNPKCIAFAITMIALYWILPKRNPWLLPLIFFGAYIAMGWYDHLYNCGDRFKSNPGSGIGGSFSAFAKPPVMSKGEETSNNVKYQQQEYSRSVNKFHVFFVAPLLLAIAIFGKKMPKPFWVAVFILALLAGAYHSFRFFNPRISTIDKSSNDDNLGYLKKINGNKQAIYAFHVSIVVPYLMYLAIKKGQLDTPTIILTGFISLVNFGYHGYKAFF
jgi:hypothetical protein